MLNFPLPAVGQGREKVKGRVQPPMAFLFWVVLSQFWLSREWRRKRAGGLPWFPMPRPTPALQPCPSPESGLVQTRGF